MLDNLWNWLMLKYKCVYLGQNVRIHGRVFVHGRKSGVHIGNNCIITSNENYNPTAGGVHCHFSVGYNGELRIGNNVGISQSQITAYDKIKIDDNVLIGACCKLWDSDFHSIRYDDRMNGDKIVKTAPIHICEGVFVGACSIVLKGVTIGQHSVIGAGSVVTKDVPENEIWAGNPAKKIGTIDQDRDVGGVLLTIDYNDEYVNDSDMLVA